MHRSNDRIERGVVDIVQRRRAIKPVGKPIKRGLLVGPPRQDLLGAFACANVAADLGGADDAAVFVPDRRYCQRNIDQAAILAAAYGLVMFDALAAPDTLEDSRLFVSQFGRNEDRDRLTDHLFGGKAEQPLRGGIPADDDAVEIFTDDHFIGGFDDAGELSARLLAGSLLGDVEQRADPAADIAIPVQLRAVGNGETAQAGSREVEFAFEFDRLAAQHLIGIGAQRIEALFAEHFRDGPADDLVAATAYQVRISLADEEITQFAAAPHQHERRTVDDGLQFRLARAQRFFSALAFGQFLKAADGALDAAGCVLERHHVHQHWDARAVGPFDDELGADHQLAGAHGARHRRRLKAKRFAIGTIAAKR